MATEVEIEKLQREDHDLLLSLHGKVDALVTLLNNAKVSIGDHEARLRSLEKDNTDLRGTLTGVRWVLGVVATIVGVIEPLVIFYFSNK